MTGDSLVWAIFRVSGGFRARFRDPGANPPRNPLPDPPGGDSGPSGRVDFAPGSGSDFGLENLSIFLGSGTQILAIPDPKKWVFSTPFSSKFRPFFQSIFQVDFLSISGVTFSPWGQKIGFQDPYFDPYGVQFSAPDPFFTPPDFR